MMPRRLAVALLTAALFTALTGCGSDASTDAQTDDSRADPSTASRGPSSPSPTESPDPTESPRPTRSPDTTDAGGTTIVTGDSPYGPMLYDDADQAIYIWEVEESARPECYGDCAIAWPPVLTKGSPVAEGDVDAALLGTTERVTARRR
jgi:hypothetical protein